MNIRKEDFDFLIKMAHVGADEMIGVGYFGSHDRIEEIRKRVENE